MQELKVLYISFIGDVRQNSYGFVKKDLSKVDALNKIGGVKCLGVSFSDSIDVDYYYNPDFLVKKVQKPKPQKYLSSFSKNTAFFESLESFLVGKTFDVAIYRYDIASLPLLRLMQKYKNKIVFEHNTHELVELKIQINNIRKTLKFSIKPGYFLYYFEGKIWPLFCEKYLGPKIRENALGGISVTNEIAEYEETVARNYKNAVVANGVTYDKSLIIQPVPYNKNELKLFMLIGAGGARNGVYRLISGLKEYQGNTRIQIDIIGYYFNEDVELVKTLGLEKNFNFIEPMTGDALDRQMEQYHISLGSLGFHNVKLTEASPLKVRESLMRGFPVIIGYKDTDFIETSEFDKFILKIPADDSPVDFNKVVEFADQILSVPNYPNVISVMVEPKIDYAVKTKQTVDFINAKRSSLGLSNTGNK